MLVSMCNTHMFYILHHPIQTRDVKTVFLTKPVTVLWKPVIYR